MPDKIPKLSLSLGQMAWVIHRGQTPPKHLLDKLRNLRLVGVPFREGEKGEGSGNRLSFDFYDLVETAVSVWAMDHGMRPKDIAGYLSLERATLRKLYRDTYLKLPEAALTAEWIRTRGRQIAVRANEVYLRIHDRYSEEPGRIEQVGWDDPNVFRSVSPSDMVERYPDGSRRYLVPLERLIIELAAWAREVPVLPAGRPRRVSTTT
jgi:hypothetical protein